MSGATASGPPTPGRRTVWRVLCGSNLSSQAPDPRTRGLTLIEILIVIGLLIALAALALPTIVQRLDARAFDAGGDVIQRHLVLARAHARRASDPVEVVYEVAGRRAARDGLVDPRASRACRAFGAGAARRRPRE